MYFANTTFRHYCVFIRSEKNPTTTHIQGSDISFLECPPSTVVPNKDKIVPALMDRAVCKSY
jgi:hypothetical protein